MKADGRGFNSRQLHHNVKSQPLSGWDFFARSPCVGAVSGHGLASAAPAKAAFSPHSGPLRSQFSLVVSRAFARSLPWLARALRRSVVVGDCCSAGDREPHRRVFTTLLTLRLSAHVHLYGLVSRLSGYLRSHRSYPAETPTHHIPQCIPRRRRRCECPGFAYAKP